MSAVEFEYINLTLYDIGWSFIGDERVFFKNVHLSY